MKRFLTLLLLSFACSCGYAQLTNADSAIDITTVTDSTNIIGATQLFIDKTAALGPDQVLQKPFIALKDFKYRRTIPPGMIPYSFYVKFNLFNSADTARSIYLYPGALFNKISIFKIRQRVEPITGAGAISGYRKITLAAGEHSEILVCLRPVKNETAFIATHLITPGYLETFKLIVLSYHGEIKVFGYIISGVLLMMILFMGTNYFLSYKREFLYNSLYSFCMFLLIFLNSYLAKTTTPFTNFFMSYFDFFLLVIGTVFYISFTRSFLNAGINYQFLNRILKYGQVFILLLLCVFTILNFFSEQYFMQFLVENIMKFLILGIGVFFIVLALKQRNPLLNYIAAGNTALVIFSAISLGLIWGEKKTSSIFSSALVYYYVGIVLELIFFLLGLTYKNRSELIERTKEQEAMKLAAEKKEYETQITIMKAQQEERNRISADMHDDLGAGMTTIRLYSELAKNKLGDNMIPEIDKISSSSNELLNKMNAIIWSMSSSNDSLGNMTAYIRSYAIEYFENTGVDCRISIPEDLPNIEVIGEIRRNVFLVVKEALNNILKHAKATKVDIILMRVPGGLTLLIQDNGVGINFDALRQFGNGLKNMKKRMEDVGIEFSIKNNNGTLIALHRKINIPNFF